MNCPVCGEAKLKPILLEEGLNANKCPQCHGHWISSDSYFKWVKARGQGEVDNQVSVSAETDSDTKKALVCPDCGRILVKYRLGQEIKFRLDLCGGCNGVWFDRDEWEVLKARRLHDDFHRFFTDAWRQKVLRDETRARNEKIFREKFGPDYDKIMGMKSYIESHPLKPIILAFIQEKDPLA
jgi:Zn-finger nucleic acid-binding protein